MIKQAVVYMFLCDYYMIFLVFYGCIFHGISVKSIDKVSLCIYNSYRIYLLYKLIGDA